ncbi:hypothetical protein TthSNM11_14440 [Thermus thermophilus]|uniref:hypothetical protein n=1 Tax=Thermus thermophilus TaxID=274 RepID=UPI001FCB4C6C|nr:hypothetical protein [Thermus thermophilus]BDG19241.1 hypothetical protein TthSNM11_14440 [Thermus thermophilus]
MGFNTERWLDDAVLVLPVAGNTTIRQGAIVVVDGGYAKEAPGSATAIAAGRAEADVQNPGGDGEATVLVRRGVFRLQVDPADPVGPADLLKEVYLSGPDSVAKTDGTGTRPKAGRLLSLEGGYAWVEVK